jgi:Spy/CpxP family protein refolding chaperone
MWRAPLFLMLAVAGVIVAVDLAYALPENPPAMGGGLQTIRPIGSGGGSLLGRLRTGQVLRELNLSDEQKQGIFQLLKEEAGGNTPAPGGPASSLASGLGGQQLPDDPAAIARQQKRLADILKPAQMERLKQLDLQLQGARALKDREVVKALGLTVEQKRKLNAIFRESEAQDPNPGPSGVSGLMQGQAADLLEKAFEVLTPAQRAKFEKMKGQPMAPGMPTFGRPAGRSTLPAGK